MYVRAQQPILLGKQVICMLGYFFCFHYYYLKDALQKHVHIFLGLLRFNTRVELVSVLVLQNIINIGNPR